MNIEKWIVAYFSPTGGTKRVADAVAAGFGTGIVEADLTKDAIDISLGKNDGLLAVLPVFAGRVPQAALKRLAELKADGRKAAAVVVYGNREYDDALLETCDALEAGGFRVIAGAAFIAEHSIDRSVAAGRPDAADIEAARRFGADVMAKADDAEAVQVPGSRPYKELRPSAYHPAADGNCVKCGLCAENCPVGAIDADEPGQPMNDVCINCMRCVQVCPQKCRALPDAFMEMISNMLKEKASGYKQPVVFL